MGIRNVLITGESGTGKTAVATELARRGFEVVHGDRELAYQGDPRTGEPTDTFDHEHHVWDEAEVARRVADRRPPATFFCGDSRNIDRLLHRFDTVFVLEVDAETVRSRLAARPRDEFGGRTPERDLVLELHRTGHGALDGDRVGRIDATASLGQVVDEILARSAR